MSKECYHLELPNYDFIIEAIAKVLSKRYFKFFNSFPCNIKLRTINKISRNLKMKRFQMPNAPYVCREAMNGS